MVRDISIWNTKIGSQVTRQRRKHQHHCFGASVEHHGAGDRSVWLEVQPRHHFGAPPKWEVKRTYFASVKLKKTPLARCLTHVETSAHLGYSIIMEGIITQYYTTFL